MSAYKTGRGRGRWGYRAERKVNLAPAGRDIPASAEAERHVIACALLDGGETIDRAQSAGVTAATFYRPDHAAIWQSIMALNVSRPPVTLEVLAEELQTRKALESVGGWPGLMAITGGVPTTAHAGYFIGQLREKERLRTAIYEATRVVDGCYSYAGGGLDNYEPFAAGVGALVDLRSGAEGLPAVQSADALCEKQLPVLPQYVKGVLKQCYRFNIAGGSKSFKTWVLLDLALSVATGTPWWGLPVQQAPVLFVNFEVMESELRERVEQIKEAKKIVRAPDLHIWHMWGNARPIDELITPLEVRMRRLKIRLGILDPIYVCLGARDENSNTDVTDLMNRLGWLAMRTEAAVGFGHHFAKGKQSEKEAKDRPSGASAWVRAPDAVITLTPHEEENSFSVDWILRGMPQKTRACVRWEHPCMRVAADLDPDKLREAGRPKEVGVNQVLALLLGRPMRYKDWLEKAVEAGISVSTFKRRLDDALMSGNVVIENGVYSVRGRGGKSV